MQEAKEGICRRLLEQGYGQGDMKAVEETVAAQCRIHDPVFPDLRPGNHCLLCD